MTVRLLVELRRGPSDVIPGRLGSDENVHLDRDAGIAVDASQRDAVNLSFVAFGRHNGDVNGQIIVFFVMTVAAAEAAVGLALVIALFRHRESLNPDAFTSLKW